MGFYEKFLFLCICEGISPSAAAEAIGSTRASATRWKNGSQPSDATIKKLADYFDVPFDYFSEDSNEKTATPKGDGLDAELAEHLRQLTPEEIIKVDAFIQGLLAAR